MGRFRTSTGFTLVELLIVVAIIGVLSTVGVPTFRRMIQKAKQAEAKVALSAIYKMENAFFNEYDTYVTRLKLIGYVPESAPNPVTYAPVPGLIYSVGFIEGNPCLPSNGYPGILTPAGIDLKQDLPQFGALGGDVTFYVRERGGVGWGFCEPSTYNVNGRGALVGFTATASGVISPSITQTVGMPGNPSDFDAWTINDLRELRHVRDGVQ